MPPKKFKVREPEPELPKAEEPKPKKLFKTQKNQESAKKIQAFLKRAVEKKKATSKPKMTVKEALELDDKKLGDVLTKGFLFDPFLPRNNKPFKGLDMDDMLLIGAADGRKLTEAQEARVKVLRQEQADFAKQRAEKQSKEEEATKDIPKGKKNAIVLTIRELKKRFPDSKMFNKYSDDQKARIHMGTKNIIFKVLDE